MRNDPPCFNAFTDEFDSSREGPISNSVGQFVVRNTPGSASPLHAGSLWISQVDFIRSGLNRIDDRLMPPGTRLPATLRAERVQ